MKDYYNILGIPKTASEDDVKKAYRRAAMKHHPDRNGGDDSEFKKIQEAYDVLSDNEKRAMVDQGMDPLNPNSNSFRSHHFGGGFTNMEDIFNNFGFNFNFGQQPRQPQRNRSMNVSMSLTLEEAYTGVNKSINVQYPNGNTKVVNIAIPQGIDNGMAIRYAGMGEDTIPGIPAGDLNIIINVMTHPRFAREGYNLLADVNIDCFDAILGTTVDLVTLDGRTLQITIPSGTQPNTTLGVKNEGMRDGKGIIGKLYLRVGITIPRNLDPLKQNLIEQLRK